MADQKVIRLDYDPQPKQAEMHGAKARQILFGGAVGGGKSTALRWDMIKFCLENPGLVCYLFRRTMPELEANHILWIKREIPTELGHFNETRKRFEFHNGSMIVFQYLERDSDCERVQGAEIHYAGLDEGGQLSAYQINYIKSRNRLGSFKPAQPDYFPRFVITANPGGISHNYLKAIFIDAAPPGQLFYDHTMVDPDDPTDKGWPTLFIPSRMEDNKYIDAGYRASLSGLPEELGRALRDGDWDLIVGSFFGDVFKRDIHVIQPFDIPNDWVKFRAFDWGSAKPFSVGWYAIAQKDDRYPDGAIIRYREWYGAAGPDRGLKMTAEEVASGIRSREKGERIDYGIADPSIYKFDGGPSIGERMGKIGIRWRRADNSRISGWDQVRQRLIGDDNQPMLYLFTDSTNLIRTLPSLQHDKHKFEDINTQSEDHAADELRYALMSRPYTRRVSEPEDADPWRKPTLNEMLAATPQPGYTEYPGRIS